MASQASKPVIARKHLVALLVAGLAAVPAGIACDATAGPGAPPAASSTTTKPGEGVTVRLAATQQAVARDGTFTLNIEVDPAGAGVSGGELQMTFDAKAMQAGTVTPGDLLGATPLVGTQEVDNQGGSIKLALARIGATTKPTAAGKLATVAFKISPGAVSGTYKIAITRVGFANESFQDVNASATNQVEIAVQ